MDLEATRKHPRMISRKISQKATRKFASSQTNETYKQENFPIDNKKVVYEETYAPIPTWINATYTIRLRTEYQQQMNDLVTPFATKTGNINALFAEENGHRYEVFIEGDYSQGNNVANLG
jgi:hypothetical protein